MKAIIALFAVCVLALTGCTKEEVKGKVCEAGKTAATIVSAQVAVELSCQNEGAIRAAIEQKLVEAKVCEKPAEGAISTMGVVGEALCTPVITGLFAGGVSQIPAEWGCTGGKLADEAKAKLIALCSKAF